MKFLPSLLCLLVFLLISGCANYQKDLQHFDTLYYNQDPAKAYKFSQKFANNSLLWGIQNGVSGFMSGDYQQSLQTLDSAENTLDKNQAQGIFASSLDNTGATLFNDNIKSYHGNIYEGILINYYKALDALLCDDLSRARVEFNRANDRQRRAKEYYQKEIQKAIQADLNANKDKQEMLSNNTDTNASEKKINNILDKQYSNLKNFQSYTDFINPLVSYVSGLFFSLQGDPKGIDLLKESYGINHSSIIGTDILSFQGNPNKNKPHTWIIIEDGQSPLKEELTLQLPLILLNGESYFFMLALPQLKDGKSFYTNFQLEGKSTQNFEEISVFDGVIANEFSKQLPYILTRAILSASYKAYMQSLLYQTAGNIGGLLGVVFSAITTSADTRITSVFPHKAWLAKISNDTKNITLRGDGRDIFSFELITCPQDTTPLSSPQDPSQPIATKDGFKICKNTNNVLYVRTTKNNIIPKLLIGEKL
ncbi:hypothetical protein BKH46_01600 [Helicobacter sp. 12S02634-8]|uniref:hypothetical protein n=1 Tax=Helicobacter sp. 12S02634-8 TaxID=1476199 RepID=UPI000BA66E77|nr:hypothetical protein [Helicobacter sp. 12S02634-8]PAF48031.1 hypothetical protein BKH46_01600 [Helicobacter sp. 12S02634-8]